MKLSEYRSKVKAEMGWKWYWMRFKLLFDLRHQYELWQLKRGLTSEDKKD